MSEQIVFIIYTPLQQNTYAITVTKFGVSKYFPLTESEDA